MKQISRTERGQALILIVFAIIGLIGMVALTVDGGNAYSDRRHAQNAADTAVMAGARAVVRQEAWKDAALALANVNGYDDADNSYTSSAALSNVEIYRCDEADPAPPDATVDCGVYDGNSNYIQVKITSEVETYFGPVIGIQSVTNKVQAIAQVIPGGPTTIFSGNAVVGLSPNDCQAVRYQGTADTILLDGGIFVNSDCDVSAFFNNSSSAQLTAPSLCAVGGITYEPGALNVPSITEGCEPVGFPPADFPMPNVACPDDAVVFGNNMSAGNYTGTFPPAGVTNLQSGTYCVYGNFQLGATDVLYGSEVLIAVFDGDVAWAGGAEPHLSPPQTDCGDLCGLLVYVPLGDPIDYSHTVRINGNSDSELTGTFLAPSSECTVNGTGDLQAINGQVICYTVDLSGTSDITIQYNDLNAWTTVSNPSLQLTK